jgi:hypothetical protein
LFNLSFSRQFTNTGEGGIWWNSWIGPEFGSVRNVALGASEPFNGDGKCLSDANGDGYNTFIEGGKNMLTNKEDGEFTITELEVWEVNFICK